jgi:hypothetical protein
MILGNGRAGQTAVLQSGLRPDRPWRPILEGKKAMNNALGGLATIAMLAAPLAADNIENPLYAPKAGGIYSRTALGLMSKEVDDSLINRLKGTDGAVQSVTRFYEDLGYGITDSLALQLSIGYTSNSDADRSGMHQGRLGLSWRAMDGRPMVLDFYADAHLGGISAMEAELANNKNGVKGQANLASQFGLNYKNYTTGQWGAYVGARAGWRIGDAALAAFAEICQKFAGSNNEITINKNLAANLGVLPGGQGDTIIPLGDAVQPGGLPPVLPQTFSVELKSTMDYNLGAKFFYQLGGAWSCGAAYTYKYHADNEAEAVLLEPLPANPGNPYYQNQASIVRGLRDGFVGSLDDGYDEHIINLSLAFALSRNVQLAAYFEYTSDAAFGDKCQNTTAAKTEYGLRLNLSF